MLFCPNCSLEHEEGKKFCKSCGTRLIEKVEESSFQTPPEIVDKSEIKITDEVPSRDIGTKKEDEMFCPNCGTPYEAGQRFCKECGQAFTPAKEYIAPRIAEPQTTLKQPKKRHLKKLNETRRNLLKNKFTLENLLSKLEEQRGIVSEDTFSSTKKLYINQLDEVNTELSSIQREISGLKTKLEEDTIILQRELTPLETELSEYKSLYKSGGLAKRDFKTEEKILKSRIKPSKNQLNYNRKLLELIIKEESQDLAERRGLLPALIRVLAVIIIILVISIPIAYVATSILGRKPDFLRSIEEKFFPSKNSEIASNIENVLNKQGYGDLSVEVINGKAILSGYVSTEEDIEIIENIVKETKGVKDVENNILVKENEVDDSLVHEQTADIEYGESEIASTIRKEFESKGYGDIKVEIKDRNVTLSGKIPSSEEQNQLISIAMNVKGVNQVNNNLEVVKIPEEHVITNYDLRNFVDNYLIALNRGNISEIMPLYDDNVDYFEEGFVTRDFIRRDKENYYTRWPKVHNRLDGEVSIHDTDRKNSKVVTFTVSFNVSSSHRGEGISGNAENILKIRRINGDLKIIEEKQRVLSRKKFNE